MNQVRFLRVIAPFFITMLSSTAVFAQAAGEGSFSTKGNDGVKPGKPSISDSPTISGPLNPALPTEYYPTSSTPTLDLEQAAAEGYAPIRNANLEVAGYYNASNGQFLNKAGQLLGADSNERAALKSMLSLGQSQNIGAVVKLPSGAYLENQAQNDFNKVLSSSGVPVGYVNTKTGQVLDNAGKLLPSGSPSANQILGMLGGKLSLGFGNKKKVEVDTSGTLFKQNNAYVASIDKGDIYRDDRYGYHGFSSGQVNINLAGLVKKATSDAKNQGSGASTSGAATSGQPAATSDTPQEVIIDGKTYVQFPSGYAIESQNGQWGGAVRDSNGSVVAYYNGQTGQFTNANEEPLPDKEQAALQALIVGTSTPSSKG